MDEVEATYQSANQANVVIVATGKFHYGSLARQLASRNLLRTWWTGYPAKMVNPSSDLNPTLVKSYPYFHVPYMLLRRANSEIRNSAVVESLGYFGRKALDSKAAKDLHTADFVIALSSMGLKSGNRAKEMRGAYFCDRGSAHIVAQNDILREEYRKWDIQYRGIDPKVIARELEEYESADKIFVPSGFALETFVEQGICPSKIAKIPYGVDLERFKPVSKPDSKHFTVLFVGSFGVQKGAPYILEAFRSLRIPNKRLLIIGSIASEMSNVVSGLSDQDIFFLGHKDHIDLKKYYSKADVLVLGSVQEGLAMVMAEALACGCPVVATTNTGARDLFQDGKQGFIVPIRDSNALANALEYVKIQGPEMRVAAESWSKTLDGWSKYGDLIAKEITTAKVRLGL